MQNIVVNEGQTLLDIAVSNCGNAELIVEIAIANGIDIDDVELDRLLSIPDVDVSKKNIVSKLTERKIIPASALDDIFFGEDEWTLYYTIGLPENHG